MAAPSHTAACLYAARGTWAGEPSPDGGGGDKLKKQPLASMLKYGPRTKQDRCDAIAGLMTPCFLDVVLQEQNDNILVYGGCEI